MIDFAICVLFGCFWVLGFLTGRKIGEREYLRGWHAAMGFRDGWDQARTEEVSAGPSMKLVLHNGPIRRVDVN